MAPEPLVDSRPAAALTGREGILLVEDEAPLRDTIGDVLRRAGYRVLVADGADQAIEISVQDPGDIELLLTDIIMPSISGVQLAKYLLTFRPQIKVLFMSGYPGAADPLSPGDNFIEKPFTARQLLSRLRDLLGSAEPGALTAG
jgi:two-component system cell cycle sensor histidine kinase/response regulator CckA